MYCTDHQPTEQSDGDGSPLPSTTTDVSSRSARTGVSTTITDLLAERWWQLTRHQPWPCRGIDAEFAALSLCFSFPSSCAGDQKWLPADCGTCRLGSEFSETEGKQRSYSVPSAPSTGSRLMAPCRLHAVLVNNNGQMIQFRGIAVSDAGRYICSARNSVGQWIIEQLVQFFI